MEKLLEDGFLTVAREGGDGRMKDFGVHIEFDIERKLVILFGQLDDKNQLNGIGRKMKLTSELDGLDIWEGQFKDN